MTGEEEIKYMKRVLALASLAGGMTAPNPMVGAVIVHRGKIIGEGYHRYAGSPHAEVAAIESVKNRNLLGDSTLFVNLEPCSHWGKTPPCSDLIVEVGIPRVIIGTIDTSKKVSGGGIDILLRGGCKVETGILEKDCRHINRRFFTFHEKERPYIILKWAESKDGYIDGLRSESSTGPNWITGRDERVYVHRWRSQEQSIMVGGNTVRIDNPELTVREVSGSNPLRLVLSCSGKLPLNLKLLADTNKTVIYSCVNHKNHKNVEYVLISNWERAIDEILADLQKKEIQSVIIEGGTKVLSQFIERGLWDEARLFRANQSLAEGVKAPDLSGTIFETIEFKNSTLTCFINE